MEQYAVALFGHRYIDNANDIRKALENQIYNLMKAQSYVEFLI